MQDRLFNENQWTVTSFDAFLGLIGGFIGLIWSMIHMCMGGYEEFRFLQEIISEIYSTTAGSRMVIYDEPQDYDEARADLTRSLETKLRYDYTYIDYLTTSMLQCFCCCCKKK